MDLGLLRQYSHKFRLRLDECGAPIFKHRRGIVYEYNAKTFGVYIKTARPARVIETIKANWNIEVAQWGQQELVILFAPKLVKTGIKFLRTIGAFKKREYDAETMERKRETGKRLAKQFPPSNRVRLSHNPLRAAR